DVGSDHLKASRDQSLTEGIIIILDTVLGGVILLGIAFGVWYWIRRVKNSTRLRKTSNDPEVPPFSVEEGPPVLSITPEIANAATTTFGDPTIVSNTPNLATCTRAPWVGTTRMMTLLPHTHPGLM
ncbi:hypothetical protein BD310DRAFT_350952, partial [Dichomitus squalens]